MPDVIIAIVPAPGHEGLVAEGTRVRGCVPERPMIVYGGRCTSCGALRWYSAAPCCPGYLNGTTDQRAALVLYAPGGPRLGMVRLCEALGGPIGANYISDVGWAAWVGDEWHDRKYLLLPDPPNGHCVEEFGGAHLAVQRGLASEVLVLPVTP